MKTPQERKQYLLEMFTFYGFAKDFDEVMDAQSVKWREFLGASGCIEHPELARKYRDKMYEQKCSDPHRMYQLFVAVVQANKSLHVEYFSSIEIHENCEYCESLGVIVAPMQNMKSGEIHDKTFRCVCDAGRIRFGGVPEATSEMLRWRLDANRREADRAREYIKSLGLDPDKRFTFGEFFRTLSRSGSIGKRVQREVHEGVEWKPLPLPPVVPVPEPEAEQMSFVENW